MDETTSTVAAAGGVSALVTWIVARVLGKPDEHAKELGALRDRVIRLESRLGSEGDVGTIMHVLSAMQEQMSSMQKMLQEFINRRGA